MFDDLKAYFYENVVATFNAYFEVKRNGLYGASRDLRTAIAAATALYHLREHIPAAQQKSRTELAQICPDYDLLGDIANVAKHRTLTRGYRFVASADNIFEQVVSTRYHDAQGDYFDGEKKVLVRLLDGSTRDVAEVLISVLDMWFVELHQLGVLSDQPRVERRIEAPVPKTREQASPVNIEITAGLRYRMEMKPQWYNYETGRVEPIDLSAAKKIVFTVREPKYELEIGLQNGITGEVVRRTVKLTSEQSRQFAKITSEQERQKFLMQVGKEYSPSVLQDIIREINARDSRPDHGIMGS